MALELDGRCALATSFACFKFLLIYGQLYSIGKMMYLWYGTILPAMDYLTIDVLVVVTMSYAMTLCRPQPTLSGATSSQPAVTRT